jgi:hypothetical protein
MINYTIAREREASESSDHFADSISISVATERVNNNEMLADKIGAVVASRL